MRITHLTEIAVVVAFVGRNQFHLVRDGLSHEFVVSGEVCFLDNLTDDIAFTGARADDFDFAALATIVDVALVLVFVEFLSPKKVSSIST